MGRHNHTYRIIAMFTFLLLLSIFPPKSAKCQTDSQIVDNNSLGSNNIESAKSDITVTQCKQADISNWRKLKPGMSMSSVYSLLGRPKLKQNGSHECIWFYQDLPVDNSEPHFKYQKGGESLKVKDRYGTVTTKIGLSDVGGVRNGILFFEAKSLDALINEQKKVLDAAIDKKKKIRDRAIANFSVPKVRHLGGAWKDPPDKQERIAAGHKTIEDTYETSIKNLNDGYIRRIKVLQNETRLPEFSLQFFNQPDWNRVQDMVAIADVNVNCVEKWQNPDKWKNLKINMTIAQVEFILGKTQRKDISIESSRYYYSDANNCAMVSFVPNADAEDRLISWNEPFWPSLWTGSLVNNEGAILVFKGRVVEHRSDKSILAESVTPAKSDLFVLDDVVIKTAVNPSVSDKRAIIKLPDNHPLLNSPDGTLFQIYVVPGGIFQYNDSQNISHTINKYLYTRITQTVGDK